MDLCRRTLEEKSRAEEQAQKERGKKVGSSKVWENLGGVLFGDPTERIDRNDPDSKWDPLKRGYDTLVFGGVWIIFASSWIRNPLRTWRSMEKQ